MIAQKGTRQNTGPPQSLSLLSSLAPFPHQCLSPSFCLLLEKANPITGVLALIPSCLMQNQAVIIYLLSFSSTSVFPSCKILCLSRKHMQSFSPLLFIKYTNLTLCPVRFKGSTCPAPWAPSPFLAPGQPNAPLWCPRCLLPTLIAVLTTPC